MKKLICTLVAVLFTNFAFATGYSCTGAVTTIGQGQASSDTKVAVAIGTGNPVYICSLDAKGSYSMTVTGCQAAFSQLQGIAATGMSVTIYFNNAYTCSTMPAGFNATDAYWIYGPF